MVQMPSRVRFVVRDVHLTWPELDEAMNWPGEEVGLVLAGSLLRGSSSYRISVLASRHGRLISPFPLCQPSAGILRMRGEAT